jgi:hypothetical protein
MQVTHVEAMCEDTNSINILLDKRAGDWGTSCVAGHQEEYDVAGKLYLVALKCIEDNKRKRLTMTTVVGELNEIIGFVT